MSTVTSPLSSDQITSLIQQASANYQRPANALLAQEKPVQAQISALGQVQSALSSLQSALSAVGSLSEVSQRSVTSSPNGVVQATATNDAAAGTYVLSNIQLAQSETLLSTGFPNSSGSLGAGSLTFQVGTADPITVNIAAGQDTLSGVATAINQANIGVQAAVLFDGTSYHLEFTGTTGAANAFTVSGSGSLSGLNYGGSGTGLTQIQTASDAQFSLNGVAITSGSNNISGALPGLTFSLAASGSATVTVSQDVSGLDQAANNVVGALNQVLGAISKNASYDPTSGAGPLLGDFNVEVLRSQLLNAISSPVTTPASSGGGQTSLSNIGFSITSGGSIAFDDTAFKSAAQTDYAAVASLLGNIGTASNSRVSVADASLSQPGRFTVSVTENIDGEIIAVVNGQPAIGSKGDVVVGGSGPAQGLKLHIADGATGDLGTVSVTAGLFSTLAGAVNSGLAIDSGIAGEIDNLNDTITTMNQRIVALQNQAQQQTLALTKQFSVAQATLSQLTTVGNFLDTYFALTSGG